MVKTDIDVIAKTVSYVQTQLATAEAAHDWWHVYRVWQLAKTIASKEKGATILTVELGALLHDIADWKFHDGDVKLGPQMAREWLTKLEVDAVVIAVVEEIVAHISYRGGTNKYILRTLEGQIVQDADRLDALGAIGIGRTFAFGGSRGGSLYNPNLPPKKYKDFDDFKAGVEGNPTINHFYEKLLLLKDKMNTSTGRTMAEHRHAYMEAFLDEFYREWDGNL